MWTQLPCETLAAYMALGLQTSEEGDKLERNLLNECLLLVCKGLCKIFIKGF